MCSALFASLSALPGCGEPSDEVRVYTARIDPPPPPPRESAAPFAGSAVPPATAVSSRPPASAPVPPDPSATAPMPREVTWEVPTQFGWVDTGEANRFRATTLRAGEPDSPDALEVAVSRMGGPGGTITANVNRWRQQLGLPPLDQPGIVATVSYTSNEHVPGFFTRHDAEDGQRATMIAWFQLDDASWFFKANGSPQALDTHREAFDTLVASVRRAGATQTSDPGTAQPNPSTDATLDTGDKPTSY